MATDTIMLAALFFIVPCFISFVVLPGTICRMRKFGQLTKDMYKAVPSMVPYNGGLIIILVAMISMGVLSVFFYKNMSPATYAIGASIIMFGFFGLLDDYIDISRLGKLVLLYYLSFPLLPLLLQMNLPLNLELPLIGTLDYTLLYLQLIAPLYVMVTANLVNMHSGFNGLAPGVSLIILITLIIKTALSGQIWTVLFIVSITGALAGYLYYEYYPAQIFWGNIGALSYGAAIGVLIVTQQYLVSGFVMLIPHTFNFLMYCYWRLTTKRNKLVKFGSVREDGTLDVPNPFTLKWLLPYYFRLTEPQATKAMFALTAVFCGIGFFIPY
jgi:UDP-N-acetylglucosamine--dolichyl-phosphate N-acetylglucosaminephosphotransferase